MSGRQTTLRLGETAETAVADKGRSPAAVRIVFGGDLGDRRLAEVAARVSRDLCPKADRESVRGAALAGAVVRFLGPAGASGAGAVGLPIAIAETVIAVALILGVARRVVYIGGALYSLLIWSTAEGFGGAYRQGSTDIGTSIIYVVVFLALLVMLEHGLDRRLALDGAIAGRLSRWALIAGPPGR